MNSNLATQIAISHLAISEQYLIGAGGKCFDFSSVARRKLSSLWRSISLIQNTRTSVTVRALCLEEETYMKLLCFLSVKIWMNGLQQIVSGHHHCFEADVIQHCLQIDNYKYRAVSCNPILPVISAVDFFNEISLIWGIVCELGIPRCPVGDGFPQGFEYRWADGEKVTVPIRCSGPQYVDYVLTWVEEKLNDGVTFPSSTGTFFFLFISLNMTFSDEYMLPFIISRSIPKKLHNLSSDRLCEAISYFRDCLHQPPSGVGGTRSPFPSEHFV